MQRLKKNSVMLPFEQSTTPDVTFKSIDYPTYAQPMAITSSPQSSTATNLTDKAHPDLRKSSRNVQRTLTGMSGVSSSIHCVTTKEMAGEIESSIVWDTGKPLCKRRIDCGPTTTLSAPTNYIKYTGNTNMITKNTNSINTVAPMPNYSIIKPNKRRSIST